MTTFSKRLIWIGFGLLFLPLSSFSQEVSRPTANTTAVALSVIEWYADHVANGPYFDAQRTAVVISDETSEFRTSKSASGALSLHMHSRRPLFIPAAEVDKIGRRFGLRVAMCNDIGADNSLCGIARPWVWLVLAAPVIEGNEAATVLKARELEFERGADAPTRSAISYNILLTRDSDGWRVTSARQSGIT